MIISGVFTHFDFPFVVSKKEKENSGIKSFCEEASLKSASAASLSSHFCHSQGFLLHLFHPSCTQDMHIISTDEKQVFAAVQEWNQNNTYSLYISDSPGVYFTLSLENLRTSRGPAGNLLVDFYKVSS